MPGQLMSLSPVQIWSTRPTLLPGRPCVLGGSGATAFRAPVARRCSSPSHVVGKLWLVIAFRPHVVDRKHS